MAEKIDKWTDAILQITNLTRSGKLVWGAISPNISMKRDPEDRVEVAFETVYKEKKLVLFRRAREMSSMLSPFNNQRWERETVLALADEFNQVQWAFPATDASEGLLSAVQYKMAGVREFVDAVLADPS